MLGSGRLHPERRRSPKGPPCCRPGDRLRHRLPHRALHAAPKVFKPRTAPKGSTQHVLLEGASARRNALQAACSADLVSVRELWGALLCVARVLAPGAAPCIGRARWAPVFPARPGAHCTTCGDAYFLVACLRNNEEWHVAAQHVTAFRAPHQLSAAAAWQPALSLAHALLTFAATVTLPNGYQGTEVVTSARHTGNTSRTGMQDASHTRWFLLPSSVVIAPYSSGRRSRNMPHLHGPAGCAETTAPQVACAALHGGSSESSKPVACMRNATNNAAPAFVHRRLCTCSGCTRCAPTRRARCGRRPGRKWRSQSPPSARAPGQCRRWPACCVPLPASNPLREQRSAASAIV